MSKMLQRLLPLLLAFVSFASAVRAQQPDHPLGLNLGDAVVSGFSGTLAPDPAQPRPVFAKDVGQVFGIALDDATCPCRKLGPLANEVESDDAAAR